MFKKLDDLLFKSAHLGLLGFLLYGGLVYVPESPVTLILGFMAALIIFWFIADILFKINDVKVKREIDRYYH
jgi:hypothetical protein